MKHFQHLTETEIENIFHIAPQSFNKEIDRETLGFSLGATLYMPSYQEFLPKIISKEYSNLTSFVMCFEDAIREEDVERGEENVRSTLRSLSNLIESGSLNEDEIPLLFLRVRSLNQFEHFMSSLTEEEAKFITGFTFPKFTSQNGADYMQLTKQFSSYLKTNLYAMPILETPEIIYKETRIPELLSIKNIFTEYREHVLNVRVGGTDFSSLFALRRGIDTTIYDIEVIADCLRDILNFYTRAEDGFVVSAPVWEYFSQQRVLKPRLRMTPFIDKDMLYKRQTIMNKADDGLLRELVLDKANGFVGKTIIHPSHISYVNAIQAVTREEYEDAKMIIDNAGGGVLKSSNGNKMNEMNPHMAWAKKIIKKASIYGVVKEENGYVVLL